MKHLYLMLLVFVCFGSADFANAVQVQLSDRAKISLITIGAGDAPEELFGHSAVRVTDPQQNLDISFNYGTFHFDAFFLPKFIYGDLEYYLSTAPFHLTVEHYRERRRWMKEQNLNLSHSQKVALYEFLTVNAKPENRYYQYDFLYDNCSTRIRDAFEVVLGENLQFNSSDESGRTFRNLIHLYVDHRSFIRLGIDLLLGSTIDKPATESEKMFLPDFLMASFDNATISIEGEKLSLVETTTIPLQIEERDHSKAVSWASYLTWGLFFAGIFFTIYGITKQRTIDQWFDLTLFGIVGLIGILIFFLWFFSLHTETVSNMNLFWAWPTHLLLIPALARRYPSGFLLQSYFSLTILSCVVILAGWSFWSQELNSAIIPILLLLTLRSAYRVYVKWLANTDQ